MSTEPPNHSPLIRMLEKMQVSHGYDSSHANLIRLVMSLYEQYGMIGKGAHSSPESDGLIEKLQAELKTANRIAEHWRDVAYKACGDRVVAKANGISDALVKLVEAANRATIKEQPEERRTGNDTGAQEPGAARTEQPVPWSQIDEAALRMAATEAMTGFVESGFIMKQNADGSLSEQYITRNDAISMGWQVFYATTRFLRPFLRQPKRESRALGDNRIMRDALKKIIDFLVGYDSEEACDVARNALAKVDDQGRRGSDNG